MVSERELGPQQLDAVEWTGQRAGYRGLSFRIRIARASPCLSYKVLPITAPKEESINASEAGYNVVPIRPA